MFLSDRCFRYEYLLLENVVSTLSFCCYLKFLKNENIFLVVYVEGDQARGYVFPFLMVLVV